MQIIIIPEIDDPDFYCRSCNYSYGNRSLYRFHLKRTHKLDLKPLITKTIYDPNMVAEDIEDNISNMCCIICKLVFGDRNNYLAHMQEHKQIGYVPLFRKKLDSTVTPDIDDPKDCCKPCKRTFSNVQSYRCHLKAVHHMEIENVRPRPRTNPDIVPDINDLDSHCVSCDTTYSSRSSYRQHLRIVYHMKFRIYRSILKVNPNIEPDADDPNNYCELCNHTYHNKYNYRNHLCDCYLNPHKSICIV